MLTLVVLQGQDSLSVLWTKVSIKPPDSKDLQDIVKERYPHLELHASRLTGSDTQFC